MPNYFLTRYTTGIKATVSEALEALETQLETVDDAKVIHGLGVEVTGRDREQCVGWAIYIT
jgi:hypothetical protein